MNWLKKLFVPHKHNDYKPHIFRETGVATLFAVIVFLFVVVVSGRVIINNTDLTALVLPNVLVDYTNENRATENYNKLTVNPLLEKAAQLKANDMAEKGYFAHKSPEGKSPWYFFEQAGYKYSYAGENLAVNFADSVDVSKAWMASSGHRANIMNGNFTEIGIATAEGMYQGRKTVFVVQMFGKPARKTTQTISPKEVVKKTEPEKVVSSDLSSKVLPQQVVLSESISTETAVENTKNYSNFWDKLIMSPKKTLSYAYLIVSIIIIIGLLSMLFTEIKKHHIRMIILALGLLIIIIGLLYIYKSLLFAPLLIV